MNIEIPRRKCQTHVHSIMSIEKSMLREPTPKITCQIAQAVDSHICKAAVAVKQSILGAV